ncbi:MAG: hypothetical protein RO009_19130 [Pseudorhodoplanes sp.]|nr:hypothetical protein [Pseudorhodoplanes sp.]
MRKLLRSASAAAALLLAAPLATPSLAGDGSVKNMSLQLNADIFSAVRVISEDGKTWSKLKDQNLHLNGHVSIEMGRGKINAWGIFIGQCAGQDCLSLNGGAFNSVYKENGGNNVKEIDKDIWFAIPASKFPVSDSGGIAVSPFGNAIVAKCNAHLANGGSINKSYGFSETIPMTLVVDGETGHHESEVGGPAIAEIDVQKTINVNVPVTCEGVVGKADQLTGKQPDFKILNATLTGHPATYRGSCPVDLRLTMGVESNIKGTFEARVEADNGGKSPFVTLETSQPNGTKGTWVRQFNDKLRVPIAFLSGGGAPAGPPAGPSGEAAPTNDNDDIDPAGQPQAPSGFSTGQAQNEHRGAVRLAVKNGNGFVYSKWWNYKVTCDPKKNPDVGRLPDGVATKIDVTQAVISVFPKASSDGRTCGITVSGLVQTNVKNVDVKFRLKNHQGVPSGWQILKTSKPNNIADFLTYFDFSKSGEGVWIDQSGMWSLPGNGGNQAGRYQGSVQMVGSNPSFTSNVATYDFTCKARTPAGIKTAPTVNVNPDLPRRPGAVVDQDHPTHGKPTGGKVTTLPPLSCAGGIVKAGNCFCRPPLTPVQAGQNAWRCMPATQVAPERRIVPRPPLVRDQAPPSRFGAALPPRAPVAVAPQARQPSFRPGMHLNRR